MRNRIALTAAAAWVGAAASIFTANVSSPAVGLRFPVLACVGSGHFSLTTRADYREHLASAQRDIGFAFVRGEPVTRVLTWCAAGWRGVRPYQKSAAAARQ